MTASIHIVDDDDDHLTALCDLVETSGFEVRAFASAQDALLGLADAPDLIISDLRMPGMDGIEFLKEVKARALSVPVVLLTGHGDVGHAVEAIRSGAEGLRRGLCTWPVRYRRDGRLIPRSHDPCAVRR